VDLLVDVYPLNTAAALAGVEDGTINNLFRSPFVNIRPNVGWVLASKLKAYTERNTVIAALCTARPFATDPVKQTS